MKSLMLLVSALALSAVQPMSASAQMFAPPVEAEVRRLTAGERTSALNAVLQALKAQYVFPDRLEAIEAAVGAAEREGRYQTADPRLFAERLSEDLSRSSDDGHLYLRYDPDQFAAARRTSPTDPEAGALETFWAKRRRSLNYGLVEQRVLPGNVRYLKISLFGWVNDETGAAYDSAMAFLKSGEAAIIDLRGNGGGAHDAVRYALSHFMAADKLLVTFLEAGEPPYASRTLTHLPAGRMIGKPLYVLVDHKTASAAEEFAYSVQQFRLGVLVGETTAGGANNNRHTPIAPGFMLSVSYGWPEHPVTGANWEAVGVKPDVEVPAGEALDRAQALVKVALAAEPKRGLQPSPSAPLTSPLRRGALLR